MRFYRNAWDGKALRVITKNSPAISTGAHISLVGHITEDELRRYLDSTEAGNGFGNRILWVYVQRSKCLPEGGEIERVEDFNPLSPAVSSCGGVRQTRRAHPLGRGS